VSAALKDVLTCGRCGMQHDHDLALDVKCPTCGAPPGRLCRRPSGHGCALHITRDQAALDAGILFRCPGTLEAHVALYGDRYRPPAQVKP
jgi:hypothetical protein